MARPPKPMATQTDRRQSRQIRLPAVISWHSFKPIYLLIWLPYILVYQATNRFPIFEPITLPFTVLDEAIPFIPELLPLYISYLAYYFVTVSRMDNDREVNRLFYATHLELLISGTIFILLPVRMPRELFYRPEIYNWADAFWRWFDAPNNCLPSLHASNCLLLMQFNWHKRYRWVSSGVGVSIIASTLFVKQHYAVDLLAGAGVYLVARWFVGRLVITKVDELGWRVDRTTSAQAPRTLRRPSSTLTRKTFLGVLVAGMMAVPSPCVGSGGADQSAWPAPAPIASRDNAWSSAIGATHITGYTGSEVCATCHPSEYEHWKPSAHAWAMKKNVRELSAADFVSEAIEFGNDGTASFNVDGDGGIAVQVSENSGDERIQSGDRTVAYLFGNQAIEQQLVVEHDGRYQALPIGFDLEKKEWFDLFPDDARSPEDWGHWSNRGMTANSECIACHTTGFEKGVSTRKRSI